MARLENHRLLRPGANFILLGAYICFFTALGIAGIKAEFPRADFYVAKGLAVLLGLMAAEILIALLLEIYRPRVKGKISRPIYDSRLAGLLGQPESLFHDGGAGAGLSVRLQRFRDVVFQAAAKKTCLPCCWRNWRCCCYPPASCSLTRARKGFWSGLASR